MKYNVREGDYRTMGAVVRSDGVVFTFEGRKEQKCSIVLYEKKTGKIGKIPVPDTYYVGALRSIMVMGIEPASFDYNFEIDGKVMTDPYARRIVGREKWGEKERFGMDYQVKSGFSTDVFDWEEDVAPEIAKKDMVMYKLHVRNFTMEGSNGGARKGTFEAVENRIGYLRDMGVTTVEFMPFYEFEELMIPETCELPDYVTWKEEKNTADEMESFGKAAAAYVTMDALDSQTPTEDGNITFTGLESGYYLITSTNGNLAMVDTTPTNPDATVNEKNPDATLDKDVQEDSNQNWGNENSAQIGDTVNFKVSINVKKGAKNYVMHDKMEDGLTFNADSVEINGLTQGADYTVVTKDTDPAVTDTCTFEIHFAQSYLDRVSTDTTLTVTYSAVLNENASVDTGEKNDAKLTWGDNSGTEWSETVTKTYKFEVLKYVKGDTEKKNLAGATFQLEDAEGNVVKLVKVSDTEYRVANGEEANSVDSFTTVSTGNIVVTGVDLDNYTLVETVAPAGYNLLKDPVPVKVEAANNLIVEVANSTGSELPSTGGMGTTIFYVLGSILVLGAAVLLITKKRMNAAA